ncbi:BNR-4 repeat-containing protein [Algibacillus agarilyticus]|uniref:BNR-4 repeat-containing protein n=1 Tax=Algibacillus agarilyticus TaxID=2234133 RepID=UPI000DD0D9E9|nr:BNR-4 repeat-containing protein [Algibacillus agarilyticus]
MNKTQTRISLLSILVSSVLLTGCGNTPANTPNSVSSATSKANIEKADYFADNGLMNPVAIVQHPAGIHEKGVTYVSYQGPLEDPYVAAYNHNTETWSGPYKAGNSALGKDLTQPKNIDNHGKPTMIMDNLGYIHVFFGGHGGDKRYGKNELGDTHYAANKHVVTKRPYDITEWEELNNITPFGTYNQAVKMDNGDIYLFYRHGAHRSNWVYQKSTDHGRTFAAPVSILKTKKRNDVQANDSWYAYVSKGHNDDIIVSYDYHICWKRGAGVNGRGHTTERHDAYYMVFDTQKNTWSNVQKETLSLPITREVADEKTLVARTGGVGYWSFNGSSHLDENGYPHIGINIGKDIGKKTGGPKQTSHYRWTGEEWVGGQPVYAQARADGTDTRGDFIINSPTDISFLLGYKENGDGIISYFNSTDSGKTFTKGKELLRREKAGWSITALIDNAHPDARLIVAEKQKNSPWRKLYLVGDNGPVQRVKSTASVLTSADEKHLKTFKKEHALFKQSKKK